MPVRAKPAIVALLLGAVLTSTAAAQSGGSSIDPNSWRTPEYKAQWGLDWIRAADAYARGVDGTGVLVGVIDTGIFAEHPEFIGRYGWGYDYLSESLLAIDRGGHGTNVASVISANRDGNGMHGVAPGATLVVMGAEHADGGIDVGFAARAYADLQARGVRIVNNSYGADLPITAFTRESALAEDATGIQGYRQAVSAGILSVWGTANQGLDHPSFHAGLPYLFPELERGWLAVTAIGPGYEPHYTNRCGVAKNWCLAAPGGGRGWEWDPGVGDYVWMGADDGILVAKPGGGYERLLGTSFAAPHVSGAAALVWQMFPFFTADQVRQTLLGTAQDWGPPGVDEIFGYGLLDAGKAVRGPGRFDWGDFIVEQPGGIAFFENDIVGAGGLVKRGAGELVLTGNSGYAGATSIEGGVLSVMGSIASPTSISGSGILAGTGVVHGAVDNGGAVWAGDAFGFGTLTISGNYVQRRGGVLVQQIDGAGGVNHLAVTGTASLAGLVAFTGVNSVLPRYLTMPVLSAGQGISGRFDGVEGPAGDGTAAFIRASLRYEPDIAHLDIRTLPFDSPEVCTSANQCGVGSGLERGTASGDRDLRDAAALLQAAGTRAGAQRALTALSGATHAGLGMLALGGFSPFAGMIEQRLAALRSGQMGPGGVGTTAMAYASGTAGNPLAAMLMHLPAGPAASESSAWLRGYGLFGKLGGDANVAGGVYRGGGVIGGLDRQFTPSFLAGISFGYSNVDADFRGDAGKGGVKAYEGALYGSHAGGPLRLDGMLGYARLGFDSERGIAFGPLMRRPRAEYDGDRFSAALEAGYAIDLGWLRAEPLAGLRYTWLRQDDFSETGAGSIGLTTRSQSAQSLLGSLGLRLVESIDMHAGRLSIEARGRWQHEFLDDTIVLDASFIGAPAASFAVQGAPVARDSAVLGAGVALELDRKLTLFADYDVRLNSDLTAHAATAGLRVTW